LLPRESAHRRRVALSAADGERSVVKGARAAVRESDRSESGRAATEGGDVDDGGDGWHPHARGKSTSRRA
jgi:hypothetical protein